LYRCKVVGLLVILCIAGIITIPSVQASRTVSIRFVAEWRQGYDFARHAVIEINGVEKHKWVFTHNTDQSFQDTIDTTISNTLKAYTIYARNDDRQSRYYGRLYVDGNLVASSDDAGPLTPLVYVIPREQPPPAGYVVKFRGKVAFIASPDYEVNIDRVITDPGNCLRIGVGAWVDVWNPSLIKGSIQVGDMVEVYGDCYNCSPSGPGVSVKWSPHYLREIDGGQSYYTVKFSSISTTGTRLILMVAVDGGSFTKTPFSVKLTPGVHTFVAGKAGINPPYLFVRWQDERGATISSSTSLTIDVKSDRTLYSVYQGPRYVLAVDVRDGSKYLVGASVFLDGIFVGKTDQYGRVAVYEVNRGPHQLKVTMQGYKNYVKSINVTRDTVIKVPLTKTK
jgi:hypothetical protein